MAPTKTFFKKYVANNVWFAVFSILSIILLCVSFILPPAGQIDPSALQAVGELFAFASLYTVIHAIDKGYDAKVTHGNTSVQVGNLDPDEPDEIIDEIAEIEDR